MNRPGRAASSALRHMWWERLSIVGLRRVGHIPPVLIRSKINRPKINRTVSSGQAKHSLFFHFFFFFSFLRAGFYSLLIYWPWICECAAVPLRALTSLNTDCFIFSVSFIFSSLSYMVYFLPIHIYFTKGQTLSEVRPLAPAALWVMIPSTRGPCGG